MNYHWEVSNKSKKTEKENQEEISIQKSNNRSDRDIESEQRQAIHHNSSAIDFRERMRERVSNTIDWNLFSKTSSYF